MSSSVGDPFLLANYSLAKRLLHAKHSIISSNIYVTYTENKFDGLATVTSQGDGIHVLDIASLHPAISHTLGPSTTFACPAVSCVQDVGGAQICTTYAVISSSPDLEAEGAGRTIWQWKSDLAGGIGSTSGDKLSIMAPHLVSRMFSYQLRVLLLSPEGALTITDSDLNVQKSLPEVDGEDKLFRAFEFSRVQWSGLLPSSEDPTGLVVVLVIKRGDALFVRLLAVEGEIVSDIGITEIPAVQDTLDVSCSGTGYVSVLASNGLWHSFQLYVEASAIFLIELPDPMSLASFTFLTSRTAAIASQEASLLPLDSSLVLLAAVPSSSSAEIVILLWDLRYSVLLASNTFTIPSTLYRSQTQGLNIHLVKTSSSQVVISLSPKLPLSEEKQQYRSSVLILPINSPSSSTIANAMGKMADGAKWLSKSENAPANATAISVLDSTRRALLGKMRASVNQNQPQGADELFFQFVKQQEKRQTPGDPSIHLGHEFVKQVARLVLQTTKSSDVVYSPRVIRYLLEQQAVASAMLDEGLLPSLLLRSDWASIRSAFRNVRDLPEDDIVLLLKTVVAVHKSSSDAMEVDPGAATEEILPLVDYLSLCTSYNYSTPALRVALRKHLPRAEDVVCILEVLESWITQEELSVNWVESKQPAVNGNAHSPSTPSLDKTLTFLQATLDSAFVALLQYSSSHELLRKVYSHIQPEIKFIDEVGLLRAPLEPFVKAQNKLALADVAGEVKKDQASQVDWRKKRKQAFAQANLNVGMYQVEELII